ncbi:MAG: T9SS type A sorting domain-containing protein [Bacteroidetes bacterium]|nr:T9SS type A sorting domain-containing protein [Bacteroidota bacterium]
MKKFIPILFALFNFISLLIFTSQSPAQWEQISNGISTSQSILSFATNGTVILMGSGFNGVGTGIYSSTNNGTNWTQTVMNNRCVNSIIQYGSYFLAGTDYGAWVSENSGANWTISSINNRNVEEFTIIGNNIFAASIIDTVGIFRSANNGYTWIPTGFTNHGAVTSLAVNGNYLYAGCGNGVYLSTNNGNNFTSIGLTYKVIDCMATLGGHLYAASSYPGAGGLFHTTNNGISWSNDTAGMGSKIIYNFCVSGENLFAGTNGGIYLSTNHGTTWIKKNTGFGNYTPPIFKLFTTNNYIFAGTYGKSVWRRSYTDIIGVQNISSEIPSSFILHQNYPNPFNPSTKIRYEITKSDFVKLTVSDITGKEVEILVNENQLAGVYETEFNGGNLCSGIYYYRIETRSFIDTKKMILIK